jgi:hypothetical protein
MVGISLTSHLSQPHLANCCADDFAMAFKDVGQTLEFPASVRTVILNKVKTEKVGFITPPPSQRWPDILNMFRFLGVHLCKLPFRSPRQITFSSKE